MANIEKTWERPWSMEEMIENADNWSLAGDVALLNTLKAFADNLLSQTNKISNNVDNLLTGLENVSLKLDISKNELQSLRNTQFIENRVYEEDETLASKDLRDTKAEEKPLSDEENIKIIRQSVIKGLNVIDKYFDKIEVNNCDDESINYMLEPKNLYIDRPLPYVIGSEEWYTKWHIGLGDSSSDSEPEKSDKISISDPESEADINKSRLLVKGSESSSELDLSNKTDASKPFANSTFNDSVKHQQIVASNDENNATNPSQLSGKSFADELAAKLGHVPVEIPEPIINTNPIQKVPAQSSSKIIGDLFLDEPPPLDDYEDSNLPKKEQTGLFSGGKGLFDDDGVEDELFFGQKNNNSQAPVVTKNLFDDDEDGKKVAVPEAFKPIDKNVAITKQKSSQVTKGLFDSEDSSDDDIFSANKKQLSKQPFLQPFKTAAPLFDEEPPALETKPADQQGAIKKKPTGGVSIFGNSDIFKEKISTIAKNRRGSSSESSETATPVAVDAKTGIEADNSKKISLFDDDDDLFKGDLFSNISKKKFTSNLFDDDETEDLFASGNESKVENAPKVDLFSDLNNSSKSKGFISLFGGKSKKPQESVDVNDNNSINVDSSTENQVIDHVEKDFSNLNKTDNLVSNLASKESEGGLFDDSDDIFSTPVGKSSKKQNSSLFDDEEFMKTKPDSNSSETTNFPANIPHVTVDEATPKAPEKPQQKSLVVSLFDNTPPPDDEWDTKSDNGSVDVDQISYHDDFVTPRSSLFDNEPPSLGPNESSGIVRDGNNTRLDTDDSFTPFASSSRRLSSDIFSDQQSNDSFFVTKNKSESQTASNLHSIPENLSYKTEETSSDLNITPSGFAEDLTNSSVFDQNSINKKATSLFLDSDKSDSEDWLSSTSNKKDSVLSVNNLNSGIGTTPSNIVDEFSNLEKITDKSLEHEIGGVIVSSGNLEASEVDGEVFSRNKSPEMSANSVESELRKPKSLAIPGKLKHSLNINVGALKPGYIPPRKKELLKSQSLELPKEEENVTSAPSPEKRVENTSENVHVLPSITKDRARIAVKRRPSTRRGRQEALRKSVPDFKLLHSRECEESPLERPKSEILDAEAKEEDINIPDAIFAEKSSIFSEVTRKEQDLPTPESKVAISEKSLQVEENLPTTKAKTIFDDIFEVSKIEVVPEEQLLPPPEPKEDYCDEILDQSDKVEEKDDLVPKKQISPEKSVDIFNEEAEDLFSPNLQKIPPTKSLFDSPDSEEDLFGSISKKDSTLQDKFDDLFGDNTTPTKADEDPSKIVQSIIFDDGSDEDIFSSKKVTVKKFDLSKKSLFEDDSSDEDIFASSKSVATKKATTAGRPLEKTTAKTSGIRKLENTVTDEDPLSSLLN